jgi:hypothetical protein
LPLFDGDGSAPPSLLGGLGTLNLIEVIEGGGATAFETVDTDGVEHEGDAESSPDHQSVPPTEAAAGAETVAVADVAADTELRPEDAGLLCGCAPFAAQPLELALGQFLDWFGGLCEDLASFWAGLGMPAWTFLALAVAAAAGEVARRNLKHRHDNQVVDAAFCIAPVGWL